LFLICHNCCQCKYSDYISLFFSFIYQLPLAFFTYPLLQLLRLILSHLIN
jgi:hypothetical protein